VGVAKQTSETGTVSASGAANTYYRLTVGRKGTSGFDTDADLGYFLGAIYDYTASA
jgi:hypothetical protein